MKNYEDVINQIKSDPEIKQKDFYSDVLRLMNAFEENTKVIDSIVCKLDSMGFGSKGSSSCEKIETMVASLLSDLEELKNENNALKSKIRDSKVFEKSLSNEEQ